MTSEIRANKQTNRVGLGTVTYTDTGIIVSGIVTANSLGGIGHINVGSNIKLGNAGVITATTFKGDGDFVELDVDGHTNLDNVNIAGVATATSFDGNLATSNLTGTITNSQLAGSIDGTKISPNFGSQNIVTTGNLSVARVNPTAPVQLPDSVELRFGTGEDLEIVHTGGDSFINNKTATGSLRIRTGNTDSIIINTDAHIDLKTNVDVDKDLDVDGHTNLDNVNIAGVTTITENLDTSTIDVTGTRSIGNDALQLSFSAPEGHIKTKNTGGSPASNLAFHTTDTSGNTNRVMHLRYDGNVGINESAPSEKLQVKGDVLLGSTGGDVALKFEYSDHQFAKIVGNGRDSSGYGDIDFYTSTGSGVSNLSQRMTIRADGKIGIGLDSPNRLLHIQDAAISQGYSSQSSTLLVVEDSGDTSIEIASGHNSTGSVFFGDTGANNKGQINYLHGSSGDLMTFHANGSERLRITNTGQLLLGDTSAFDSDTAIQFTKNNSGNNARFIFRNTANNGNSRVRLECMTLNNAGNTNVFSGIEKYQSGGMHIFNGESTNQYSGISLICGNHNVFRLKNGNHSGNDCAHIQAIWGTSNGLQMEVGGAQSGTHKAIRFYTSHYGGERGYIGVTLGGTSYNSSSDYRQKQDVVDLTGAIDRVKSFKPRRFKWKDDPTYTVDGFLAHEAQTVVPESVVGEKDAVDKNGDPEYQVIDQSKLVPLLTAALQEAITEIETLKTKVDALEGS